MMVYCILLFVHDIKVLRMEEILIRNLMEKFHGLLTLVEFLLRQAYMSLKGNA